MNLPAMPLLLAGALAVSAPLAWAEDAHAVKGEIVISGPDAAPSAPPLAGPVRPSTAAAADIAPVSRVTIQPAPAPPPSPGTVASTALAGTAAVAAQPAAPVVVVPAPVPVPPPSVSYIVSGGESLRDVLTRWTKREGWQLVWDADMAYEIRAGASFGPSMLESIERLAHHVWRDHEALRIEAYKGNRLIHVWEDGQ